LDRYARRTKVATTVVVALILGVAGCGAPESSFGREATVVAVITRRARGRAFRDGDRSRVTDGQLRRWCRLTTVKAIKPVASLSREATRLGYTGRPAR
jgi:hypothetical protein